MQVPQVPEAISSFACGVIIVEGEAVSSGVAVFAKASDGVMPNVRRAETKSTIGKAYALGSAADIVGALRDAADRVDALQDAADEAFMRTS